MARIYPFRAWRYNPAVIRLEDVVSQPYDKISPAMQQAYYQRSPYNLVRIILGLPELFDAEKGESVYTRAARDFRTWRDRGVLIQEKDPCVLAYAQRFTDPGSVPGSVPGSLPGSVPGSLPGSVPGVVPGSAPGSQAVKERRGFIALGKLYEYSEEVIFRHEETLSRPKADRLNLLKTTRAHFGQIFMLYSDPAGTVERLLFDPSGPADAELTDEFGVLHRLWRINDPATLRLLLSAMQDKKLIIADGHHRYETALHYSRAFAAEYAAKHGAAPVEADFNSGYLPHPDFPEAAAMMTFVNMDSDGLVILPTHRVIHGLAAFDTRPFANSAAQFFTVKKLPAADADSYLETLKAREGTAFVAVTRAGAMLLEARPEAVTDALADIPERRRRLDLTQLHALLIERVLGVDAKKICEETHVKYLRDAGEAVEQVRRGDANIAFLTNPVNMNQLREVAFAGEVMPQKSTDFYPKLLSGLAIYALD